MRNHPIYQELLDIGGKDRSLNPSVLRKYDHLLQSPEVQRRASEGADVNQRAVAASAALRDAVETLPTGTRRTVGQAALCATKDYEGLLVERRKELLEADGISNEMFRYHREEAFAEVIVYLEQSPDESKPKQAVAQFEGRRHDLTDDEQARVKLVHFARLAADVHYAGLADLFCTNLESFLWRKNIFDFQLVKRSMGEDLLRDYVFKQYVALLYWPDYPNLASHIASLGWRDKLVTPLLERIGDATPLGPRTLPEDETLEMPSYTLEEKQRRRRALAERAHRSYWRPWYHENCRIVGADPGESALVPIVAASGLLASALIRQTKIDPSFVDEKARLVAYKVIASHYAKIDELAPLGGGLSLRQRAEAYFDLQGTLLTNSAKRGIIDSVT